MKLESMNIPFLRPTTYYHAEMVKSDHHMEKILTSAYHLRMEIHLKGQIKEAGGASR